MRYAGVSDDRSVIRIGRIAATLQVVAAVLLVVLIALYVSLFRNQGELQDSIREDAIWGVYQLDRETRKLGDVLLRYLHSDEATPDLLKGLSLRYDILYSRLNILENARYQDHFTNNPEVTERIANAKTQILAFEPVFNAIAAGQAPSRETLDHVEDEFADLVRATEDFLIFTNSAVSSRRAESRAFLLGMDKAAAGVVAVLFVSLLALIVTLRHQASSARALALRSERVSEELARSRDAAEAGNRAKSQFMATIGHEIRTPLNAILGMAELLNDEELPADSAECVQVIRSSGQTLLEMLTEILDYSKIEHGKLEFEYRPVAICSLVDGALDIVRGRAQEKGLVLRTEGADKVCGAIYRTDPTRVRQVLINLLGNAVKFTDAGEIVLKVERKERAGDISLRFDVSDTGIGIDAKGRKKLFEPFTQVDSSINRRFGGTGLGLTICKHIVEAMGGKIGMHPNRAGGSVFWFEIPIEFADDAGLPEPAQTIVAGDATLPVLRTLLVEDNAFNVRVATRFLERLGQTATVAGNGEEAVRIAEREAFDLILMDLQMPVMDGIGAVKKIRAGKGPNARTRIIAMTANASEADRSRCFEVGFDGFETKPFKLDRLRAIYLGGKPAAATSLKPQPAAKPAASGRRAEMIELFGEEGYDELLASFRSEANGLIDELAGANDTAIRDRILHTLKGAALNVGLDDLAAAASALRAFAREEGEAERLREHFASQASTREAA